MQQDGGTGTAVRDLLDEGRVEEAARVLGRPARVEGAVVHGAARGRELLGFPTANLDVRPGSDVPADGVYAGRLLLTGPDGAGGERRWPAAISVGTNPTFDGLDRTVEAYALDRDDLELYGRAMAVEFVHRIRGQIRFDDIGQLIEQMNADVEKARLLMSAD